jgi:hypothetical protein
LDFVSLFLKLSLCRAQNGEGLGNLLRVVVAVEVYEPGDGSDFRFGKVLRLRLRLRRHG